MIKAMEVNSRYKSDMTTPKRKKLSGVGVAIRYFRQQADLSQEQLAERMELSPPYISMLESGKRYPSIEMLIRVALALEIRPGELLDHIAERYVSDRSRL